MGILFIGGKSEYIIVRIADQIRIVGSKVNHRAIAKKRCKLRNPFSPQRGFF